MKRLSQEEKKLDLQLEVVAQFNRKVCYNDAGKKDILTSLIHSVQNKSN